MANLFTFPEAFDNAAWTKIRSSISADAVAAPNGSLTADKIIDTTDTNTHEVTQSITYANATLYWLAIFAKTAGEISHIRLQMPNARFGTNQVYAVFNLSTGVVTADVGPSNAGTSSTAYANGWFRLAVGGTSTSAGTSPTVFYMHNGSSVVFTGSGSAGFYIWGATVNIGTPEPYLATAQKIAGGQSRLGAGFGKLGA